MRDEELLKLLSRIIGRGRADIRDARRLYAKTMVQSRNPNFFTPDLVADDFDGRMEVLALHLSVIMHQLRSHGESGQRLSQALYDVMVDDFDVALREECLADTGVARRIKPMAKMVLTRAKYYSDALSLPNDSQTAISDIIRKFVVRSKNGKTDAMQAFVRYTAQLNTQLSGASLGDIAQAQFDYPPFQA